MPGSSNDKSTVLATFIENLINTNKASLSVDNVLYGEQNTIPSGITVTVTPGTKIRTRRIINAPSGGTRNAMEILITLYGDRVDQSTSAKHLEIVQIAEGIEDLLHQNTTMGGNCTDGFVSLWNPGISFRSDSRYFAIQMVFNAFSTSRLGIVP